MADFHSDFLDAYFKGAALGQENRNRQQAQAQFDARQAQEAAQAQQRFSLEQQAQANAKAYQDAMVGQGKQRLDQEQANKLRDDARQFEVAGGQYVPTPQEKTVDVGNVAPMAPQQAPPIAPVGPQVPSDVQAQNLPIANRDAGQTLFNTESQISPQAQLQDQGFRASQAYAAPPGMTAVLPTPEAARAQALAASQAGFVDTPPDIQALGFGAKMDPKILQGLREKQIEAGKASPAGDTHEFMQTISQLQQTEGLPPNALTDVGVLRAALEKSKLPAEQKAKAIAYLATKTTPESTATTNVLRMFELGNTKPVQVQDANGNLMFVNANDLNAHPGQYSPVNPSIAANASHVRFENLDNNIQGFESAIRGMDKLSVVDKAELATALKSAKDGSGLDLLIQGGAIEHMRPEVQNFLRKLNVLREDAQMLTATVGAKGVGEDMRQKVDNLIGNGLSGTDNLLGQAGEFKKVVSTLRQGLPGTAQRPNKPQGADTGGSKSYADYLKTIGQ